MKYKTILVEGTRLDQALNGLVREINARCEEGWKPQGGVSVTTEKLGTGVYYAVCQAMIKEDK